MLRKHEYSYHEDIKVISELKKRKDERKKIEESKKQLIEREWKDLPLKSDIVQLKFFFTTYGPLKGEKEYKEWKGVQNLQKTTSKVSDFLAGKNDDDDLLNEILL